MSGRKNMTENPLLTLTPTRAELKGNLQQEIGLALGLKGGQGLNRAALNILTAPILNRICDWGVEFDGLIRTGGISEAARAMVPFFFNEVQVSGQENIPAEGPVILAANHPTGLETFPLAAFSERKDFIVVASEIFFLEQLPALRPHMIITSADASQRTHAVRESIRHLKTGGMLMIYPTGLLDPDPQFFANAKEKLAAWSRSLSLFIRQASETKIVPAIISNVFAPHFLFSPLTARQYYRIERQKMSTFLQGLSIFAFRRPRFNAAISFGEALTFTSELARDSEAVQADIQSGAERLLAEHLVRYPPTKAALWPEYPDRERF